MASSSTAACKVALVACLVLYAGCRPAEKTAADQRTQELEQLQAKHEARSKQLKAMDVPQLARELEADSEKGREPFNSMAYREMVSRGKAVGEPLSSVLTHGDRSSFLGLLALRATDPERYRSLPASFRVNVLTDALSSSTYFNAWGLPNFYWNDAAKALIEEDDAARPALLKLLRNTREAPLWGSEGAVLSREYHFRVCDYALALLNEIEKREISLPKNPAERDRMIEEALKGEGKGKR